MEKSGRLEIITGPMFSGKCHGKGTRILMFDKSIKNVEDLKHGDLIMGDDCSPREVLILTSGNGMLYLVRQEYGIDYVVNYDHILSLKNERMETENISIEKYLRNPAGYRGYFNFAVFEDQCANKSAVDYYDIGSVHDLKIPIEQEIQFLDFQQRAMWIAGQLENNWEFDEKNQRFSLLQKDLSIDFVRLLRGIGLKLRRYGERTEVGGTMICRCPFRKISGLIYLKDFDKKDLTYEINIEEIGYGDYYGFILDKNHLYMLEDYTVTHNTTELLRRLTCDASVGRNILFINHEKDNRTSGEYSTHNPLYVEKLSRSLNVSFLSVNILPDVKEIRNFQTIGIDEGQFYKNILKANEYVKAGKRVIISGLNGDSDKKTFGEIYKLIPNCEKYDLLHAICIICAGVGKNTPAHFTRYKSGKKDSQICVGGKDAYIPVCREHYDD